MTWAEAASRWYGVTALCTWALAPLVGWLCIALKDRGVAVTRPIAILISMYPAWLLASAGIVQYGPQPVVATLIVGGALGWSLVVRGGNLNWSWVRCLAVAEAASLALFALYLWMRGFTPQILGTEKPMDVAFLASSARALTMPPPDPWFAGEPINYYYLGYLLHGTIGRLAAVPPEIGFNLALATIFSMTTLAAFGVAWNAARPWFGRGAGAASGLLAAFLVSAAGNLYAPSRLLQNARETVDAWWWDSAVGIGWRSSRIVCDGLRDGNLCPFPATETINEFPFFSFLLGDLHPHLMALPYTIVAIALAWNLANQQRSPSGASVPAAYARIALSGAVVGALFALNAWDFPTFLLVCAVGAFIGYGRSIRGAWAPVALLSLSAVGTWLPFYVSYHAPLGAAGTSLPPWLVNLPVIGTIGSSFAMYVGPRTSLGEYLTIFGVPYLFGIWLIVSDKAVRTSGPIDGALRPALIASAATVVTGVLLAAPVIPLCGVPLAFAVSRLVASPAPSPRAFALAAYCCAWFLAISVELIYVRDLFDDRMNTLFKFYYQSWTLYALATGVAVAVLWSRTARLSVSRGLLVAMTTAAIVAGMVYPTVAAYQWTEGFKLWRGLDGLSFGEDTDADDVAAIRWLAANSAPHDVLLEAAGCSYRPSGRLPFNRFSAFTGIPTLVGWGEHHQRQWRAGQPALLDAIDIREDVVASVFANPSSPLVDDYGVRWLVIGSYESGDWQSECETAGRYPGIASPDFPGPGWEEAFRSGDTRIYRRNAD